MVRQRRERLSEQHKDALCEAIARRDAGALRNALEAVLVDFPERYAEPINPTRRCLAVCVQEGWLEGLALLAEQLVPDYTQARLHSVCPSRKWRTLKLARASPGAHPVREIRCARAPDGLPAVGGGAPGGARADL